MRTTNDHKKLNNNRHHFRTAITVSTVDMTSTNNNNNFVQDQKQNDNIDVCGMRNVKCEMEGERRMSSTFTTLHN